MDRQHKGLYYNYDEKYVKDHHCKEYNLFQIDAHSSPLVEDLSLEEPFREDDTKKIFPILKEIELVISIEESIISLHALSGISAPQMLKIKGYIKHHPLVVLIDSGNNHNFVNKLRAEVVHCFIHPINNFHIFRANRV